MKKRILVLAVAVILLALLANTTLAYFTDTDKARNVITSGGIDVEIVEQQLVDGTLQPYPNEPIPVMPGTTVSKIVSARNADQTAWIRMRYTVTVLDAAGKEMEIPAETLAQLITVAADSDAWSYKDGWWYYNTAVASGETTKPLFEEVVFSGPNMGNQYQNCTVIVDVTAQAVQQTNNGNAALEAIGWPKD